MWCVCGLAVTSHLTAVTLRQDMVQQGVVYPRRHLLQLTEPAYNIQIQPAYLIDIEPYDFYFEPACKIYIELAYDIDLNCT